MEFVRNLPEDENEIAQLLGYKVGDLGRKSRVIYYLTFPDLFNRKKAIFDARDDERQRMIDEMEGLHGRAKDDNLNVRILVLDDLGKEYGSTFNDAAFDEVLRSRYDKALPSIVTTNVLLENWGKQYKDAMGSFAYEAFRQVTLDNSIDLRRSN
jgi:DNA replication protein DnaC